MRDDGAFLGEALDVFRLLLEIRQRDEEREVGVLVAGLLEHPIEDRLHPLPHRVAERLDDHASADRRLLGEIGRLDDLLIPLRVVLGAGGGNCVVGHGGLRAGLSKGNGREGAESGAIGGNGGGGIVVAAPVFRGGGGTAARRLIK